MGGEDYKMSNSSRKAIAVPRRVMGWLLLADSMIGSGLIVGSRFPSVRMNSALGISFCLMVSIMWLSDEWGDSAAVGVRM